MTTEKVAGEAVHAAQVTGSAAAHVPADVVATAAKELQSVIDAATALVQGAVGQAGQDADAILSGVATHLSTATDLVTQLLHLSKPSS